MLAGGEIIAGKFCVERIIATGGVGVVVAARHLQLGETVALKFLIPQEHRDATDVARFVREAQSAVKLKNEHVARVLDVGSLDDGAPYMVMEYLEGSDLDRILRQRGPLPIADAVDYVMQACEAIAEAHHLGIVHRDIKPSNFFLTKRTDGSPLIKILDFGIAKARAEMQQDVSLTKTRTVLGSPVYMSPEQIRSAKSVDHRTDIWSLGVTLYELLADQLPFDGDSITGVAAAVTSDDIAPIRSVRPEIPIGLALIVEKCLAKKLGDRYQSVAEFAAELVPYGPESAHYSLTRIRGSLGLRASDAGTRTLAEAGADESHVSDHSATQHSSPEIASVSKATRTSRMIVLASLLLALFGALLTYVNSRRGSVHPAPVSTRLTVNAAQPVSAPLPSASVVSPIQEMARVSPAPASERATALSDNVRQTRIAPSTPQSAMENSAIGHKIARPNSTIAQTASSKARSQKGDLNAQSSPPARYEAIFDTRK